MGKQGTLAAPNGTRTPIAGIATAQNTTVSSLCQQMGHSAVQSAAALRQGTSSASGIVLPTMPSGMPPVPGLSPMSPGMPAIPGLPSMPATPGTAPAR